MSLQVWLPLNGDLHNQGLTNITVTNNGATVDSNGKIGKCYSFNGSNNYLISNSTFLNNNIKDFSYTCWFKPTVNTQSMCLLTNRTDTSLYGIGIFCQLNQGKILFDDGGRFESPSSQIIIGQWNHLAFIRKKGQYKKIYLNGTEIASTTVTGIPTKANANKFTIGASQKNTQNSVNGNYLNGYLNDVRIYDHALSPKEVKEISNALILHLKLNNNNKVYDCSGYKNNGIIIKSLTLDNTSPRYDNAIHFSATNQKIQISNLNVTGFSDSYTFSWWGKVPDYSNKMMWGFSNGVRLNGIYNGVYWNTGDGTDNPIYEPGTNTQVTAPTGNKWHHYVMVGNGSNNTCKIYINGELFGQAKTYKTISGTEIFINGWLSNTKYSYNNMSISDFRLYATVLDDNEIKKLYNISGAIDNDGNLYIRKLVE